MPYFFIIPAYIALLIGLIVAAIGARFIPRFQPLSGYIVGSTIGTLVGFVIANILVVLTGVAPAWFAQKFTIPDWFQHVSQFFVVSMLFIGPFIGSAIGVLFGFAAGLYFVYRRRNVSNNTME